MPRGCSLQPLDLGARARVELESRARSRTLPVGLVRRAEIVLRCADGLDNGTVADELGTSRQTVGKWRERFRSRGPMGLYDERRPGKPRTIEDDDIIALLCKTLDTKPADGSTQWSCRAMADATGLSKSTVQRAWSAFGIQPHRQKNFKLSTAPFFVGKVHDIVGLYLRHGTTTLFAALDVASGQMLSQCKPRHRHQEFLGFLKYIDANVPPDLAIHLVIDNYGTHKHAKVKHWLAARPRYHLHFTPTYSS